MACLSLGPEDNPNRAHKHTIQKGQPVLVTTGAHCGLLILCEKCARASLETVKQLATLLAADKWPEDVRLGVRRLSNR